MRYTALNIIIKLRNLEYLRVLIRFIEMGTKAKIKHSIVAAITQQDSRLNFNNSITKPLMKKPQPSVMKIM